MITLLEKRVWWHCDHLAGEEGASGNVITLLEKRAWRHCDHLAGEEGAGIVITLLGKRGLVAL